MIKAILFDLDGTLCNSIPDIARSGNKSLAKLGLPPYTEDEYKYFVGSGVRCLIERMLAKHPHTDADFEQLLQAYSAEYGAHALDETCPYDGIRELLDEMKQLGIRGAVISNKPMPETRKVISTLFRPEDFAYVYGQTEPYAPKPDPACVHHVLAELGLTAEDCLYVGDTNVDMKTAHNAGLKAVGALWGFRTRQELVENHAEFLCENPRDIIPLLRK